MEKTIDVGYALRGKPRPHYLRGIAHYYEDDGVYHLRGVVFFPLTTDSIRDRMDGEIPHVNIGDAYFGLWNAMHVIAQEQSGIVQLLATTWQGRALRPMRAEQDITLDLQIFNLQTTPERLTVRYKAAYSFDQKLCLELKGNGVGVLTRTLRGN